MFNMHLKFSMSKTQLQALPPKHAVLQYTVCYLCLHLSRCSAPNPWADPWLISVSMLSVSPTSHIYAARFTFKKYVSKNVYISIMTLPITFPATHPQFKPYLIMLPWIILIPSKHSPCFHSWPLSVCSQYSNLWVSEEEGNQVTSSPLLKHALSSHLTHSKLPRRAKKFSPSSTHHLSDLILCYSPSHSLLSSHTDLFAACRHVRLISVPRQGTVTYAWNTLIFDLTSWLPPLLP